MNTYTYELDGNLYVNLTNKCTNDCAFCVRNEKAELLRIQTLAG